jgi:hypothetical protein
MKYYKPLIKRLEVFDISAFWSLGFGVARDFGVAASRTPRFAKLRQPSDLESGSMRAIGSRIRAQG